MVVLAIMALGVKAQYAGIPDGKRVIITPKEGEPVVLPMENIKDMVIREVTDARVDLSVAGTDDASVRIAASMGTGCSSYMSVCYPTSQAVDQEALQDYILDNGKEKSTSAGTIEYIDLSPETQYTVAVLAFDEFDFPCDITTVTASTTAPSGVDEEVGPGSFLYADGTWSRTLKTNKTPIAIVFSTDLSAKDRAEGYTHGYAMALNTAGAAPWTTEADEMESGDFIGTNGDGDLKDLDGRIHSGYLMQNPDIHPAAAAAASYGEAPASTSGWYLPSSGQVMAMLRNLGKLQMEGLSRQANGAASWSPEVAATAVANIDGVLSLAGEGRFTPFSIYTWTSSEASVMSAYYVYCHPSGGLNLQPYYKNAEFDIRPVLAF